MLQVKMTCAAFKNLITCVHTQFGFFFLKGCHDIVMNKGLKIKIKNVTEGDAEVYLRNREGEKDKSFTLLTNPTELVFKSITFLTNPTEQLVQNKFFNQNMTSMFMTEDDFQTRFQVYFQFLFKKRI